MAPTTNNLTLLFELGFEDVGAWTLAPLGVQFTLHHYQTARNILYAFVIDQEVVYIGKSTQTLVGRMNGYQKPGPTQRTNIANHARLIEILSMGRSVQILAFICSETILYRGIPINLAAGLEDTLIDRIQPRWNKVGIRKSG
jgi:hypothetical protein